MFRSDWVLVFAVFALLVVGLIMVYSASYGFSLDPGPYDGQPTYFVKRQIIFALLGLALMVVFSQIDYRIFRRFHRLILFGTLATLIAMAIIGRWLFKMPAMTGDGSAASRSSVQPSELAKIGAMIFLAEWLADAGDRVRSLRLGLAPFFVWLGLFAFLIILQPNFSTAVLLIATAAAMLFVAGADLKRLALIFPFGASLLGILATVEPYRVNRLLAFSKSPFADPQGSGYQVIQSWIALNSGKFLGLGLGQSQQKFHVILPHTDIIYAIIGEELGALGVLVIISLYGIWVWRGLRIALGTDDRFGMLLAVGIVAWVTFQAALHIAVLTGSAPFTGTVLPFISYGGSSLVTGLMAVGILLSISRVTQLNKENLNR